VDLAPHSPPIQIPAVGGSFSFDVAIEDTYAVASNFDAWVEATLPGGRTLELAFHQGLTIDSNSTINRYNLVQEVPGGAPAGTYTYTVYAGTHPDFPWAQDSFTFEKLSGPAVQLDAGSRESLTAGWRLRGFFGEESSLQSPITLPRSLSLSAHPNPFNAATVLSFQLQVASFVKLEVFDVKGRNVGARSPRPYTVGFGESRKSLTTDLRWYPPGTHQISFDGSGLASGIYLARLQAGDLQQTRKLLLIK